MTTLEITKKASTLHSRGNQRSLNSPSTDSSSFEEIYKVSYSHGLEAIYALENVDIKSVRRIETAPKLIPKKPTKIKTSSSSLQEEFDLGDEFRGWILPFIKKEPIHVLELSRHAERCLIENGKNTLGALIGVNLKDLVFLRGMGQGHIEEMQQKLNTYLEDHALDKCYKVDFVSWLKCIMGAQDRKKVYSFLESYHLNDLISLTPGESVEVRKLTLEKKQEWAEELLNKITNPQQKNAIFSEMQQIFNVFIKPWIRQRGGFATLDELQERIQRISTNAVIGSNVMSMLQSIYFASGKFFNNFLCEVTQEVYCCDKFHAHHYKKIIEMAISYFYKPSVYYHLNELTNLMEREFAKTWVGFKEGYVEKVLRLSPAFQTVKSSSGFLSIHLR